MFWILSPLNLATLVMLSFAWSISDASSAATEPSQADVEAVYLFDFGKFVRWPAGAAEGPLRICVAGPETFANGLQTLVSGESIEGRALAIRRIVRAEDTDGCAVLFIDAMEKDREAELLAAVAGKPILTVSDCPDFVVRGGMIQFVLMSKRVRFTVNLKAANQSNLDVSSELLKVAVRVIGAPEGGAQ
jgi:hypothetical protein